MKKFAPYIAATALFIAMTIGYNRNVFSWGLFDLFLDSFRAQEGIKKVEDFDPDRDILYLPPLGDKNLFEAINDLSICRRRDVRRFVYAYLTNGRQYTIRAIRNSYRYEQAIDAIFSKYPEIPPEIALLPLLESGFNPFAVSRSRAVGLWQFVANTSVPLGLRRDRWIDERRDVEKSTEAAIRHLKNLYGIFGSWELTLAAYNGGAGGVKRAMIRSGASNLWQLCETGALRPETAEYVPRFIALVLIYRNQRLFNIRDEVETPEQCGYEKFELDSPVRLCDVAGITGTPLQTLRELNPALMADMTPPDIRNYPLCIPQDALGKLTQNQDRLYQARIGRVVPYRVKRGDSLSSVSRKFKKKTPGSLNSTI